MVDTLKLGGIKLSGELVQMSFLESAATSEKMVGFLRRIAAAEISIPHLHQVQSAATTYTTLCVATADFPRLFREAEVELQSGNGALTHSVGTITLFPHRFALELYTRVAHALFLANIPLLGMSSSVSALVIHCDYHLLDEAVAAILTECELPDNHTPLRPVVLLGDQPVETIAVYWEPKIRIYGMDVLRNLTRIYWRMPTELFGDERWHQFGAQEEKFRLLLGRSQDNETFFGELLTEERWRNSIFQAIDGICPKDSSSSTHYGGEEVDLVSFHGPHFQDRYGIAERVFDALQQAGIDLLSSGCTGTSVHLVVHAGQGDSAAECLADVCIVPS